jgi:tetratricopeptide (TPR) repeat protein
MVARVYRGLGRFAEAEEAYRKAIEISPTTSSIHLALATVHVEQGRIGDALAVAKKEPRRLHWLCALSIVLAAADRMEQSKKALDELKEEGEIASYEIAQAHASRGDIDEAFEWLERGYRIRHSGLHCAKVEPMLRPLHSDPRWQTFLEKMGLAG